MLNLIEEKKEARAGALIGGRVQLMSDLFRKLNEQKDFKKKFKEAIDEVNALQKKRIEEGKRQIDKFQREINSEPFDRPGYLG